MMLILISHSSYGKSSEIKERNQINTYLPVSRVSQLHTFPKFTKFIPDATSRVIYVSSSMGHDTNNGLSELTPVKTIPRGYTLTRPGKYDFLLLKRGDVWREKSPEKLDASIYRPHSGQDSEHPFVISYYGKEIARPRVENASYFIFMNGAAISNFALIGLDLFVYTNDPADSYFTGKAEGGLSFVTNGDSILLEDNKITYGGITFQSYPEPKLLTKVAVRYNIVSFNYAAQPPCNAISSRAHRPSGMYAALINGLLVEGNLFDHNGHNEAVVGACATIYNHNFYFTSNSNVLITENLITRGSSMGIKVTADNPTNTTNLTIDNNFIYDNEIGLSISGNDHGNYRFNNITVTNNVISETGLGKHTERGVGWAMDTQDFDTGNISNNYILHQTAATNSHGLSTDASRSPSYRNVTIESNLFYAIKGAAFSNSPQPIWDSNIVANNLFIAPPSGSCTVNNTDNFKGMTYRDNKYSSTSSFCLNEKPKNLSTWLRASGEKGASIITSKFIDPTRTLETYASSLGFANVSAFLQASQQMNSFKWNTTLTAPAINAYIKAGFSFQ